jgi:cell division protein FtsL
LSRRSTGLVPRAGLAAVLLVGSLVLVAYRQARALEALAELDRVRADRGVAIAERADLERRIQSLESRSHVVPEARRRLGMRTPDATEIVYLPGEAP